MKNKRLVSLAVALVFILSCGFSVLALGDMTLGEWISIGIDPEHFDNYSFDEWSSMSIEDRRTAFNYVITSQGGTPHFTDEFLSDLDKSHELYSSLSTGFSVAGGFVPHLAGSVTLELEGQADLGLGFYNDDYTDTPAGELNDEFLDYIQQYPYSGVSSGNKYQFSNGYYVDYEPLLIGPYNLNPRAYYAVEDETGVTHSPIAYGLQFYLHDETGKIIDIYKLTNNGSYAYPYLACDVCQCDLFSNFTVTAEGKFYFDFHHRWTYNYSSPQHVYYFNNFTEKSTEYNFPWWDLYGSPAELPDGITSTATDENGNQIQVTIDSDGVTYDGNTYNYNNDNTVTINGDTYHITVDPSTIDDNYYNQFLGDTINNYYNYYNTTETPFDDTDILTALKSIFSSLESFRSSCYTQFKQLYDSVRSIPSSITKLGKKLDTIIEQLKKLNKEVEHLTEEEEENNKLAWLDLVTKFKNKVGWSALETSMNNISVAFFGTRSYSFSSSGDINVTITSSGGSVSSSSMPSLSVTILGCKYDLYTCLGSLGSGIDTIKSFISLFLWIGFIVSVFRSIPSIIGGVSSVQDHSNNVVIDKRTGEVKRGA